MAANSRGRLRSPRWVGGGTLRVLATILLAPLVLSGCVAGAMVRLGTWERDPSPFWVVMRDGAECAVVFGTVLMREQESDFIILDQNRRSPEPPYPGCRSKVGYRLSQVSAHAFLRGSALHDLDLSDPKGARNGPGEIYWRRAPGEPKPVSLLLELSGLRLGQSFFCSTIRVDVEWLRVIYNAGMDKDIFVVVGEGSRECSFP